MQNFHVPLPDALHRKLKEASLQLDRPATEIARLAIEAWLAERAREREEKAMAAWATENAEQLFLADVERAAWRELSK